jgi:tRNA dimethylallyltransferase
MKADYNLIAVLGPTASGKTAFAARLAAQIDGEIISADSRQVYRQMNIGTGKDYEDYLVNGKQIPFHLIDMADPGYRYSVFEYQRDFFRTFLNIHERGRMPVLCGGSGLYIDAATRGYRMKEVPINEPLRTELATKSLAELAQLLSQLKPLHNTTDTDTVERAIRAIEIERFRLENRVEQHNLPPVNTFYVGIRFERSEERERITRRLETRLQQGMVEEVRHLLATGLSPESLSYYGLEYRYVVLYLTGQLEYSRMVSLLNTAIHQFAKRQRTWFRKMEREGCTIHWLEGHRSPEDNVIKVLEMLDQGNLT